MHYKKQMNICCQVIFISFLGLITLSIHAGPNRIDILELVPGVSDLTQVRQARTTKVWSDGQEKDGISLEIGGHIMTCPMSFINGKLAELNCFFGQGFLGRKKVTYTKASNIEVYGDLSKGFTQKFGKPDTISKIPTRTKTGVEYEKDVLIWKDSLGNKLTLSSLEGTVDMGMFLLESEAFLRKNAEDEKDDEAKKKF